MKNLMQRLRSDQQGYTLVEVGLFLLLLAVALVIFSHYA